MRIFCSVVGALALCGNLLLADSSKIAPGLLKKGLAGNAKVIVLYKQDPSLLNLAQIPLVGGLLGQVLRNVKAAVVNLPVGSLEQIANDPNVAYIAPDRPLTQLLDYSAAAVNAGTAMEAGLTGRGIGVAVIDSGVANSPDLTTLGLLSRVVYRQSFVNGPQDGFGHGTHVAGIIGANGLESSCSNCTRLLRGLAPDANIIDLQVLDKTGAGSDSSVIQAIDTAIQLKSLFNIRVINLSLGRPVYESYKQDPLCQAVEAAWKAGIVVVVAAGNEGRDNSVGNDGYGTIQSPANDPYVITVGAMKAMGTYSRTDDLIASYSSKGPAAIDFVVKPDVVAPGNHVVSLRSTGSTLSKDGATAVPYSYYEATTDNNASKQFMMLNGTSMATPVVSGAVADLLQGEPALTPDQVKARIMKTAYKQFPQSSTAVDQVTGQSFTSQYDIFTIGAGYLDIGAAMANHDVATGTAMSPTATYDAASGNVYLAFDPSSTWYGTTSPAAAPSGARAVWGAQSVWGANTVDANRAVWGTRSVWGTSTVSGFRAVWGTQGVWGAETDVSTSTIQGTRAVWGTNSQTSDSDASFTVNH